MEARQKILLDLGEGGCYFLCMVHLAEELGGCHRIDAVPMFLEAIHQGLCKEDCTILKPAEVMHLLYPARWYYHKEGPNYIPEEGEFEILRYENPTPKQIFTHFVLGDRRGGVQYDPLGNSHTVAEGYLVSKRILRLVIGEG